MPATSGSRTQASTSAATVAELESIEASQFKNFDLAWVEALDGTIQGGLFRADFESLTTPNGTTVLFMRNSNPAFGAPALTPGRWVTFDGGFDDLQSPFVYAVLVNQTAIPSPGPTVLLTTNMLTAPLNGNVDVDVSIGASRIDGPSPTTRLGFTLEESINAGAFTSVAAGGSGVTIPGNLALGEDAGGSGGFSAQTTLSAGDTVVYQVSAVANLAGSEINPFLRPTQDQLTIRGRFFRT